MWMIGSNSQTHVADSLLLWGISLLLAVGINCRNHYCNITTYRWRTSAKQYESKISILTKSTHTWIMARTGLYRNQCTKNEWGEHDLDMLAGLLKFEHWKKEQKKNLSRWKVGATYFDACLKNLIKRKSAPQTLLIWLL